MITVDKISKSFGEVKAVKEVSLTAEDGKITALLGANGAGKTTSMRMIYAL
ncbi:MAG: ATP-binding cassette domain-containing protein, partial [Xanthomonadales bacterium]|nr:ATP-binding cassette domain-containing protein [Xanthomonadales bacterium]